MLYYFYPALNSLDKNHILSQILRDHVYSSLTLISNFDKDYSSLELAFLYTFTYIAKK